MGKEYIALVRDGRKYRLYVKDIKKSYKINKPKRPRLPSYFDNPERMLTEEIYYPYEIKIESLLEFEPIDL